MTTKTMRQGIPHVDTFIHLNNAAGSLPDASVYEAISAQLALEARSGSTEAMAEVSSRLEELYPAAAKLLGGAAEQVVITDSHTNAWQKPFLAIDFRPGDVILVGQAEWGGNLSMIHHTCQRTGAMLKVIPDDASGRMDLDALRAAVDDRVRLVCATWVAATSGLMNPVADIGRIVAGTNALYFIDAAQVVGQLPVDVQTLNCDLLTVSARKFVRGPRGSGFSWMSKRFLEQLPPIGIDQFSGPWTGDAPKLREDARRFESGESSYAVRLGLLAALQIALQRDLAEDCGRIRSLAAHARARLGGVAGVSVLEGNGHSAGLVTFVSAKMPPAALVARLKERAINIAAPTLRYTPLAMSRRGFNAINRISPHAFNTMDEIDAAVDAIAELLSV